MKEIIKRKLTGPEYIEGLPETMTTADIEPTYISEIIANIEQANSQSLFPDLYLFCLGYSNEIAMVKNSHVKISTNYYTLIVYEKDH